MKFAVVDGVRREAAPGVIGTCPGCEAPVIPKCGAMRLHHWAHRSTVSCDPWREAETEWHRAWKNHFPIEWQEVWHRGADGVAHIADVKTPNGAVLEFQHSPIAAEERLSREAFYRPMAWVVDGTSRKRDLSSFCDALSYARSAETKLRAWIIPLGISAIVDRWAGSRYPVFLDFGDVEFPPRWLPESGLLWWLRYIPKVGAVATPVYRQSLIDHYLTGASIRGLARIELRRPPRPRLGLPRFEAHLARKRARKPRF
ncbi:competence protein CoiA [Rhizobium ruizarguesonis]